MTSLAMTTVATLEPSVRLVVLKFLMKSHLVPDYIPRIPINRSGDPISPGKKVLVSTPNIRISDLRTGLMNGMYVFVGARANARSDNRSRAESRSDVRFTFCHNMHLNNVPPHPTFTARYDKFVNFLIDVTERNIWSVQAYLNPYLLENDAVTEDSVLLLDCADRKEVVNDDGSNVMVYERREIRDGFSKGIGPKIPLINKASQLNLVDKDVKLITF